MPAQFTTVQAGPECSGSGTVAVTTAKAGSVYTPTTAGNMLLVSVLAPTLTPFSPPDGTWLLYGSAPGPAGVGHVETWCLPGIVQPGGITSVSFSLPPAESSVNCHGGLTEFSAPAGAHPVVETVAASGGFAAGPVGATTIAKGYGAPENSDRVTAANYVDTAVSGVDGGSLTAPVALTFQKFFLGGSGEQAWILNGNPATTSNPSGMPSDLAGLLGAGCQILLCTKPSTTLAGAPSGGGAASGDYASLITTVNVVQAAAAAAGAPPAMVVLWQEANNGDFASGTAYADYYNYYAPAVEAADAEAGRPAGYTLVGVDFATNHTTLGNYQQYYPGDRHTYFVVVDYYGNTYNPSNGNPPYLLDVAFGDAVATSQWPNGSLQDLADYHLPYPVPFGVGETGMAQQAAAGLTENNFYYPAWTGAGGQPATKPFCNYLADLFAGRLAAGKPNLCVNWFSGVNSTDHNLLPDGDAGYDLTPGINHIYTSISKYSPSITGVTTMPLTAQAPNGADVLGYAVFADFFSSAVSGAAWTVPAGFAAAQQLHNGSPDCWLTAVNTDLAAGTPAAASGFSAVAGALGWAGMLLTVRAAVLAITTPSPLPNGAVGIAYGGTGVPLAAADGTGPYTWTLLSGTLPAGLTLSPAGLLSGIPTAGGSSSFTVKVTDAAGNTATQAFTLTATATAPSILTTVLPTGTVGDAYTEILQATSGVTPYTWAVIASAGLPAGDVVPPGLTFSPATGEITGTPTVAGAASILFQVTDHNGSTAQVLLTFVVLPPAPSGIAELQVDIGGQWVFPQPQSIQDGAWQAATLHTVADGAWN